MQGSKRTTIANRNEVPRAERIARLNDKLRTSRTGGQVVITSGVSNLPRFDIRELLRTLREYADFDPTTTLMASATLAAWIYGAPSSSGKSNI